MLPIRVTKILNFKEVAIMLTQKQMNFCKAYIENGGNATEAYLEAYNWTGGRNGAMVEASRMLDNEDVQAYLVKL